MNAHSERIDNMLKIVSLELKQANDFVEAHHRHHKPARGHRFSIGCVDEQGVLRGACIVGRPVARAINHTEVLEITRLATDGTFNACSILYGAAARAGKAIGYKKIQTYILESESGTTLKASGWTMVALTQGGQWTHTDGKPRRTDQPTCKKSRWERVLNT